MPDAPLRTDRLGPLVKYGDAWLAAIIDSSDDAIVSKTLEGVITSWNFGAHRIFGYTAEEAVGQHITLIIPADRHAEEREVLARIGRGERIDHFETVRLTKDGRLIDVSLTVSPVRDIEGHIVGASKIARDISERRRIEAERKALDLELRAAFVREQKARADAEAANRSKDDFLATLSHELRTPLNAVFGWARILAGGRVDPATIAKATEVILRNSAAQVRLVEDLVDVSRIITGKMRIERQPLDPKAVVEAAVDAVRTEAAAKGVRLHVSLARDAGTVEGEAVRLQQVVWNLLNNAIKFTPSGGAVHVDLQRHASEARVIVSDTGEGIPADVLPFIFDRFRQAESGSTRRHGGLGIGLALVHHFVALHGGTVSAESFGPGQGSRFTVTLPLATAKTGAPWHARPNERATLVETLKDVEVLAVDDDADGLELCRTILTNAGARVTACTSSAAAMDALSGDWWPDVLLADLDMPGENGFTLLRRALVLAEERGRPLLTAALTAYGSTEDRIRILDAGFHLYLAKPVDPADLRSAIAKLTGRAA